MPDVGRFFNIDPLAEKYTYNSTYAFSENRVIDARELEGLEKVLFQNALKKDVSFNKAYNAQRQTSGGQKFSQTLKSQNRSNVLYVAFSNGIESGINQKITNKKDFNNLAETYGIAINNNGYDKASENGTKDVQVIGLGIHIDSEGKNVSNEQVFGVAATLNHEEVAHATNDLNKKEKTNAEEHKDFYGEKRESSPDATNVLTDKKYEGTEARKNFTELKNTIDKHGK